MKLLTQRQAEQDRIQAEQARIQAEQTRRIEYVEAKQQAIEEGFRFFTVLAWAKLNDLVITLETAQRMGKRATALSNAQGIPIDRVRDPRFGQINAYQEAILQQVFNEELSV